MRRDTAVLAALAAAVSSLATAQTVTAVNPASVASALQAAGYRAELTKDKQGDPKIQSSASGSDFAVFFYNCEKNINCVTVQFSVGFDVDKPLQPDIINNWNREKRFTRAYLDKENDPWIELDIDLDRGGISQALFIEYVRTWDGLVGEFKKRINF